MIDSKQLKQAQTTFDTLCSMLDERDWKYDKDQEKLFISCGAQGEDLPITLIIQVDADRQIIALLSQMAYDVPENKRAEIAVAVSAINYVLVDGSFDFNFLTGALVFRMTSSFKSSLISKAVFEYMLFVSCGTVDRYNDKLLKMTKDEMSLEQLFDFINNK